MWNLGKMGLRLSLMAASILMVLSLSTPMALASDNYYQGKTVKLIVGYSAGGGFDAYARILAPHIAEALGAKVIVENQPGAGGIVALNKFVQSDPDGLSIMLLNGPSAALAQLLGHKAAKFDLHKVNWLGRIIAEPKVLSWGGKVAFKTVADAKAAIPEFRWGAGGKTEDLSVTAAIMSEILGLNSKIILGYKGSKKVALAAMQQEVHGMVLTSSSTRKYASKGNLTPFMTIARNRSELLPDVPTIYERMTVSDEQQIWIDFYDRINEIGRVFIASPGVASDRVKTLSDAVHKVLSDEKIVAMAKKQKRLIHYLPAANVGELLLSAQAAIDELGDEKIKTVLLQKYY
jgi:putative tricarboxylic transport membrane protein